MEVLPRVRKEGEMGMMRQKDRILRHLEDQGSITQREADDLYGITRLGARIWDLKHDGYNIVTERETSVNRYGDKTAYARYRLVRRETA